MEVADVTRYLQRLEASRAAAGRDGGEASRLLSELGAAGRAKVTALERATSPGQAKATSNPARSRVNGQGTHQDSAHQDSAHQDSAHQDSPETPQAGDLGAGRRHKFGATRVEVENYSFDSRTEERHNAQLCELRARGEVLFFLRQVPFHFEGKKRYTADFMVFWSCGAVTVEDPKGMVTREFLGQMDRMHTHYPHVCVETVKKGLRRPATQAMERVRQVPAALAETDNMQPWDREHCGVPRKKKQRPPAAKDSSATR